MSTQEAIVVGIDGSSTSADAFCVAAREAGKRSSPLLVVHGWLVTDPGLPLEERATLTSETEAGLVVALHQQVIQLMADEAVGDVEERVVYGYPGRVLVELSTDASLVVVGSHGAGAVRGALLGSVSQYVLEHATCPVMVVHARAGSPSRIVVGVDGSPTSLQALRWGDAEARRDDVPLVAVHAGAPTFSPLFPGPSLLIPGWEGPAVAAERLDGWIRDALGPERAAAVERICQAQPAASLLLGVTGPDDLLVVGRRGTGGVMGLLLGSVSRRVAAHAPGTVVVLGRAG